jgi:uncharacterized membrane protein SpoIIM required for sporulation
MRQAPFEAAHAEEWNQFERFTDAPDKAPSFDLGEVPSRYRRLCQGLALAADRRYSPQLVDRLNRLALRGHHVLYADQGGQAWHTLDFLTGGFPALIRREWRLVLVAAALFFGPMLALIAVLQIQPEFVHYLLEPEQIASFHTMYNPANKRLGMREADSNVLMFGFYIWNNVRIGFQTFAGGLLFGVGSMWFLGTNGVFIGAVAGYVTQVGYGVPFWSFVAGHSSLELLAIVLSGVAGLRLGLAVIAPGRVTRKAALVAAAKPAVRVMYGAAIMFCAAAFVEAFWSPLTSVPFAVKIGVGVAGWILLLAYFLFAGRGHATR